MLGRVLAFPEQILEAYRLAREGPPLLSGRPRRVLVVGMGGSAIGGDFLRAFAESEGSVPVSVSRGYELPAWADEDVAAVFVSYSGTTEETLEAWRDASRRGIARAAVTSGGELRELAAAEDRPCLRIPGGSPPRAALGLTSLPLFHALAEVGGIELTGEDVEEAADACRRAVNELGPDGARSDLREWAERAALRWPVVYTAARPFAAVATRWVGQINENGKCLAHAALFPEQNHNEIVGWELPSEVRSLAEVALLADDRIHPRVRRRFEIVAALIRETGGVVTRFGSFGDGLLARMLSLSVLGDLASLFIAAAREADPTPVASIERLKVDLSGH